MVNSGSVGWPYWQINWTTFVFDGENLRSLSEAHVSILLTAVWRCPCKKGTLAEARYIVKSFTNTRWETWEWIHFVTPLYAKAKHVTLRTLGTTLILLLLLFSWWFYRRCAIPVTYDTQEKSIIEHTKKIKYTGHSWCNKLSERRKDKIEKILKWTETSLESLEEKSPQGFSNAQKSKLI